MKILAYYVEQEDTLQTLNPNYKQKKTLGKDLNPQTVGLPKGIHLHFILPSALKHGFEDKANKAINYPHVPDKFIVTRIYFKEGKIVNDCNIVDSNFITKKIDEYGRRIIIPYTEGQNTREWRYIGRQYSGFDAPPTLDTEYKEDHYNEGLYAIGPGDPIFNAYYPNCQSVFGYYDDLKNVPDKAILTYSVIGYYSEKKWDDIANDLENHRDTPDYLKDTYKLTIEDGKDCNSFLLFGEVCNIDRNVNYNKGIVNLGVGRTSAEALSAIIMGINPEIDKNKINERTLTMLQYDMSSEIDQVDGNFKIDDGIHAHGFTTKEPLEIEYDVLIDKDTVFKDPLDILRDYTLLCQMQREFGNSRRTLEFKKNALYYLWEMYMNNNTEDLAKKIDEGIDDITEFRMNCQKNKEDIDKLYDKLKEKISKATSDSDKKPKIDKTSAKPFYYPKDPALMLFGEGMKRTFTFGEDGCKEDETLFCLNSPLSCKSSELIKKLLNKTNFISVPDSEEYLNFLVMTVLLDKKTCDELSKIGMDTKIIDDRDKPYSSKHYATNPIVNENPDDEVILLMEWGTNFFKNNETSSAISSLFDYGNTDYTYYGNKKNDAPTPCSGKAVLTPHGVYYFSKKIEKYIQSPAKKGPDQPDKKILKEIADRMKDLPALSQNLGGFTIRLDSLKYAFQLPMVNNPSNENKQTTGILNEKTQDVYNCLYPQNKSFYEPNPERLAVIEDRENTNLIPLREGFLDLNQLSIISTFGHKRDIFKDIGSKYISECMQPEQNGCGHLPLALTTPARLTSHFISATKDPKTNEPIPSCSLPGSSPIIGIIMPDMLNRNLDIFDNNGELLGVIKRKYINCSGKKIAIGSFMQITDKDIGKKYPRIESFIKLLTDESQKERRYYFTELMNVIDQKLNNTIPMCQNDFIFGRALVLAEISIELEFYGGTEYSKNPDNFNVSDDKGLRAQPFTVKIGDINRVTDGVICGFYGKNTEFEKGFAASGYNTKDNQCLNAEPPKVSGTSPAKVTLLLDPSMKVTLSTGFLPIEQIQINANHTDFSNMDLMLTEMNTLISEENKILLPNFTKGKKYLREYPKKEKESTLRKKINIEIANSTMETIGTIGKTMITDGFIVKSNKGD